MFRFLLYFNLILIFIVSHDARSFKRGRLTDNDLTDEIPWPNLWFPHPPNYRNKQTHETANVAWEGPETSDEGSLLGNENATKWSGLWFPQPPNYHGNDEKDEESVKSREGSVGDSKNDCDNGKYDLSIDFDPEDKRHSYNYLCLGKRSEFSPNLNTSALIQEHIMPITYEPPVKCLNESIEYSESLPTFGAYRPLAPKFGTYKYLPPQRWLHSLADGAIVLLYHPCAFAGQIKQLENILKGCLYHHIITPSQRLTAQRPMALLAWGKSLQMSVVDDAIVIKFIRDNAKLGFRQKQHKLKSSSQLYDAGLLSEAHLVTDEQDKEICGYKEMR